MFVSSEELRAASYIKIVINKIFIMSKGINQFLLILSIRIDIDGIKRLKVGFEYFG